MPFIGESQIGHTEFPVDTVEVKPGTFRAVKFHDGLDPLALAVEIACRSMVAPKGPNWYFIYQPYMWSQNTWVYLLQTEFESDEDLTLDAALADL